MIPVNQSPIEWLETWRLCLVIAGCDPVDPFTLALAATWLEPEMDRAAMFRAAHATACELLKIDPDELEPPDVEAFTVARNRAVAAVDVYATHALTVLAEEGLLQPYGGLH